MDDLSFWYILIILILSLATNNLTICLFASSDGTVWKVTLWEMAGELEWFHVLPGNAVGFLLPSMMTPLHTLSGLGPTKKTLGWPWTHISFKQDPDICWVLLGLIEIRYVWLDSVWFSCVKKFGLPCVCEWDVDLIWSIVLYSFML